MPSDRLNMAVQIRGGPDKHKISAWVLVRKVYAYFLAYLDLRDRKRAYLRYFFICILVDFGELAKYSLPLRKQFKLFSAKLAFVRGICRKAGHLTCRSRICSSTVLTSIAYATGCYRVLIPCSSGFCCLKINLSTLSKFFFQNKTAKRKISEREILFIFRQYELEEHGIRKFGFLLFIISCLFVC